MFQMPDPLARLMELFVGHANVRGVHGEPELDDNKIKWNIKRTARTLQEKITREHWEAHVEGRVPLGIVPIKENNKCNWGSIDYDQYEDDPMRFIKAVKAHNLPLVPCRSKSGGLHLFLFLRDEQPAGAVQAVLRELAAKVGAAGSEIFPKQTQLMRERGDFGNWMCMPYLGTDYGGKLRSQVGIMLSGEEQTLEEFLDLAESRSLDAAAFEALATHKARRKKQQASPIADVFTDGPPCLEHLANGGFPEGGRNNALFMLGVYFKKREPTTWQQELLTANHERMNPPLAAEEVVQITRQLEKKDYRYTCKVEPMCSHCDVTVCRTRKHGVGSASDFPIISGVSKLLSDPPIWFLDINGHRVELLTEQMASYAQFNMACAREFNHMFTPMKHSDWVALLSAALEGAQEMEAPAELTIKERMRIEFSEFLTNRACSQRREELLNGAPWYDEEHQRYYFLTLDPYLAWRQREGRDKRDNLGRSDIVNVIEELGGGKTTLRINKKTVPNIWWLPATELQQYQIEEESTKDEVL